MNLPKYDIRTGETAFIYEFISEGDKGSIQKMINFQHTNLKPLEIKILSQEK